MGIEYREIAPKRKKTDFVAGFFSLENGRHHEGSKQLLRAQFFAEGKACLSTE